MNKLAANQVLETALDLADADDVEVSLIGNASGFTRLADNVITQNVANQNVSLHVRCAFGQSHGQATTNDLDTASLKAVVERAQSIAKISPPDPEYLPPVEACEVKKYSKVKAYFLATAKLSPLTKAWQISQALNVIKAKNYRLSGGFGNGDNFFAFANSAGLRAYHRSSNAEIHATALGTNGSGWAEKISNDVKDINVTEVASRALEIAETAQNAADIPAGKYTVILRPAAVAELLLFGLSGFDAKATDEQRTFLRGKLGTQICGNRISIRSDPSDQRCLSMPFCDDGLVAPACSWIEQGMVKNLFYSRFWAKKQGRSPTGWPSNIIMEGGDDTVDRMIAATPCGLLVTRFWYIRDVDPMIPLVTGMTRDGLFLIENGKVAKPVKNMRFNENLVDVLNRVEMLGTPERTGEYISMLVPPLKIRDFNFTSTTKF
ncbi:MAG: TldD/PmbA family protein [Planctomycetota bacterium]